MIHTEHLANKKEIKLWIVVIQTEYSRIIQLICSVISSDRFSCACLLSLLTQMPFSCLAAVVAVAATAVDGPVTAATTVDGPVTAAILVRDSPFRFRDQKVYREMNSSFYRSKCESGQSDQRWWSWILWIFRWQLRILQLRTKWIHIKLR